MVGLLSLNHNKRRLFCKFFNPFLAYVHHFNGFVFKSKNEPLPKTNGVVDYFKQLSLRVLGKLCVETFGMRMMYPGVVLQNLFKPVLAQGRAKLIETKGAKRAVVHTYDEKNAVDTVFIDKRNTSSQHGQYLIICCDGNAAFYEQGIFGCMFKRFLMKINF